MILMAQNSEGTERKTSTFPPARQRRALPGRNCNLFAAFGVHVTRPSPPKKQSVSMYNAQRNLVPKAEAERILRIQSRRLC